MRINEARYKGKEIAFINGIYYRAMDPAVWEELTKVERWSKAESELIYEQYERALDRIEKFLQL